jgi:hypothetical protein
MLDDSVIYLKLLKIKCLHESWTHQEHPNQNVHQIIQITNQEKPHCSNPYRAPAAAAVESHDD